MVIAQLTPQELALHERAIAKLRAQLFRKFSPADYFIIDGSECVLEPSAEVRWMEGIGDYRLLHFGGLAYEVDCGEQKGAAQIAIQHDRGDRFFFHLASASGHTVSATTVRYRDLDEWAHKRVALYRQSVVAPVYSNPLASSRR